MCDKRRDVRGIASEVGMSFGAVQSILTNILGMSKVLARWVPMFRKGFGLIFLGIACLAIKMIPSILFSELQPKMRHGFTTLTQSQNAEQTMEAP